MRTWKVLDSQQFYLPVFHIQQYGPKFCHSTEIVVATENSQWRNILEKQGTNLVVNHNQY